MKYEASQAIGGIRLLELDKILWVMQKTVMAPTTRKQSINGEKTGVRNMRIMPMAKRIVRP